MDETILRQVTRDAQSLAEADFLEQDVATMLTAKFELDSKESASFAKSAVQAARQANVHGDRRTESLLTQAGLSGVFLNEIGPAYEVGLRDGSARPMDERDWALLEIHRGKTPWREAEARLKVWAHNRKRHPIREKLERLEAEFRAAGGDPIGELTAQIDGEEFSWMFRRWLIGACRRAFTGRQNPMLVLKGQQGVGKSEFVRWLGRPFPQYLYEGPIDLKSKELGRLLLGAFIWEVAELGATTRKADVEALKAVITMEAAVSDVKYERALARGPALPVFVGTVNHSGFLADTTGYRRFLVAKVDRLPWILSLEEPSPESVWGQAMALWRDDPDSWRLTPDEAERAAGAAGDQEAWDPLEDVLLKLFEVTGDPGDRLTRLAIVEKVAQETVGWHDGRARAAYGLLERMGAVPYKTGGERGFGRLQLRRGAGGAV